MKKTTATLMAFFLSAALVACKPQGQTLDAQNLSQSRDTGKGVEVRQRKLVAITSFAESMKSEARKDPTLIPFGFLSVVHLMADLAIGSLRSDRVAKVPVGLVMFSDDAGLAGKTIANIAKGFEVPENSVVVIEKAANQGVKAQGLADRVQRVCTPSTDVNVSPAFVVYEGGLTSLSATDQTELFVLLGDGSFVSQGGSRAPYSLSCGNVVLFFIEKARAQGGFREALKEAFPETKNLMAWASRFREGPDLLFAPK